jgi:hypothetical protein
MRRFVGPSWFGRVEINSHCSFRGGSSRISDGDSGRSREFEPISARSKTLFLCLSL